jgi:hypothetical protein
LEGLQGISRESYGKTAKKCSLLLLLMWVVLSAVLLLIGGTLFQAFVYLAAILFFCLWLNVLAPRKNARKSWDALVCRCGEDSERITRFYEDHLEIDAGGSIKTIPYGDIAEIKQTKQLYLLVCKDKVGVMLTKDGFVSGSAEDVTALIAGAQNEGE